MSECEGVRVRVRVRVVVLLELRVRVKVSEGEGEASTLLGVPPHPLADPASPSQSTAYMPKTKQK